MAPGAGNLRTGELRQVGTLDIGELLVEPLKRLQFGAHLKLSVRLGINLRCT